MSLVDYGSSSEEDTSTNPNAGNNEVIPASKQVHGKRALTGNASDNDVALPKSARVSAPGTISMLTSIESIKNPNAVPAEAETAADATELHISLTRPLYLQELHLGRFISDTREAFKNRKRFNVSFSGVQSFSNDDNTRSFLSLRIGSGHAELEHLVAEMDMIAERYSQPTFYPDPQFHVSFAWAVGGDVLNERVIENIPELHGELGHDLRHCSVMVRRVAWKTGQKDHTLLFLRAAIHTTDENANKPQQMPGRYTLLTVIKERAGKADGGSSTSSDGSGS
ncbi:poly(U)-specific 3'-to-5' RNA exonuclease [Mortierella sp. GBA30]|nr:poly(U)-specific 3'-to-5' RNA exonuclease [Mortierella sp. GBA30]